MERANTHDKCEPIDGVGQMTADATAVIENLIRERGVPISRTPVRKSHGGAAESIFDPGTSTDLAEQAFGV